jgi:L-asparaginase
MLFNNKKRAKKEGSTMTFSVITVGGTIDKEYGTGRGVRDLEIGDPVTPSVLEYGLHLNPTDITILCKMDSLDMEEGHRSLVCQAVFRLAKTRRVLISHGTDTLIETARAIEKYSLDHAASLVPKRVVLFGASLPACLANSDAERRVGFAAGVLLASSEPGVIIAMDGIHTNLATCYKGDDGIFRTSVLQ